MLKFQQTTVLHRLLSKWTCIAWHTLFNERKISTLVNLRGNYYLQARLYVESLSWLYFTFCVSPVSWKEISGSFSLVLANIFCSCWKADRCLRGVLTFRYPEQNSHFPTQIGSSHSPLHLRKWWLRSSSFSVNKRLASSLTFACSPTPNSSQQQIILA